MQGMRLIQCRGDTIQQCDAKLWVTQNRGVVQGRGNTKQGCDAR